MYEPYLAHFGVKGMKWGVRRYRNPDGTLTKAGRKQQQKQAVEYGRKIQKNWTNIHNKAADTNEPKAEKIFNKYKGVDFKKNRKAYRKYVEEYVSQWNDDLVSEVKKQLGDAPENVTSEDILSLIPTSIGKEGIEVMYNSLYED